MFAPLLTERLILRPVVADDTAALIDRRNDPAVAELQSWTTPFTLEQAEALVAGVGAHDAPPVDQWWMLTIERRSDGAVIGDLALHRTWDGRSVEIGYTLASTFWGAGYATEAASGLVDHVFDDPVVTRVSAMLHPENHRSARVLENLGMVFEGRTRLSYWVGDDNSDDLLYGMTRDDYDEWNRRPRGRARDVALVEVTHENLRAVLELATHKSQERFVAPVFRSIAQAAHPEPFNGAEVVPWYRAITADGDIAGFVMLEAPTATNPEPYLWRLSIDRRHQRRGIGRDVLELVVERCRTWGAASLLVSWEEGPGSPRAFYETYGFVPTGELVDGETEARLLLDIDS